MKDILFSSASAEWATPDDLFAELNSLFHFDLDACASAENAKCPRYFTKEQDALKQEWRGNVWMNPPYGRSAGKRNGIDRFMKKAYEASLAGATVVCLVPSRTCTKWWHGYARRGIVAHLPGRLKFYRRGCEATSSATFPSAIVIFFGGKLGQAVRPMCDDSKDDGDGDGDGGVNDLLWVPIAA